MDDDEIYKSEVEYIKGKESNGQNNIRENYIFSGKRDVEVITDDKLVRMVQYNNAARRVFYTAKGKAKQNIQNQQNNGSIFGPGMFDNKKEEDQYGGGGKRKRRTRKATKNRRKSMKAKKIRRKNKNKSSRGKKSKTSRRR